MKRKIVCSLLFLSAGVSLLYCSNTSASAGAKSRQQFAPLPRYTVTDLGTLGGKYATPESINDKGQVVGVSNTPAGGDRAFLWQNGKMESLPITPDAEDSAAKSINDLGEIVGIIHDANKHTMAVTWVGDKITVLNALDYPSMAESVNDEGLIAGEVTVGLGGAFQVFTYSRGRVHDIGTLGGTFSEAYGINGRGVVVGDSYIRPPSTSRPGEDVPSHAFVYSNGKMHDLGTLPGGKWSVAVAVNDKGTIVGQSDSPTSLDACLWRDAHITDLGTMGGGGHLSIAMAINNKGEIVGYYRATIPPTLASLIKCERAFLVVGSKVIDLNTLLVHSPGWTINAAHAINDRGQIVGYGERNGRVRAVLLNPTQSGR